MEDNNFNDTKETINNQKESLINWEKELKMELQKQLGKKVYNR